MLTKTLLGHKKLLLALAVAWTLMIAVLCLVSFDKLPSIASGKGADKWGHMGFHFGFTILWYVSLRSQWRRALLKVFLCSLFYGVLIELLQGALTTTRRPDVYDVAANTTGAALAVVLVLLSQLKKQDVA